MKTLGVTTGPLFSDAIRLRPGAPPIRVPAGGLSTAGRRSFQEPVFVPQRAKSTHAPNGGLDIDALVNAAQTGLAPRVETLTVEECCDMSMEQHDVDSCMEEQTPFDTGRAAEEAVHMAALAAHRVTAVPTGLRLGAEHQVDTEGLVKKLGEIKRWWKRKKKEDKEMDGATLIDPKAKSRARMIKLKKAKDAIKKATKEATPVAEAKELVPEEPDPEAPAETEGVEEARAMIEAHAIEQGVDLRYADMDTFAMYEHMITAVQHIDALR